MKRLKLYITSLLVACSVGLVAAPAMSYADSATQTACIALGSKDCSDNQGGVSINSLVTTIVNIFSIVVGVVAVIMIILGGFRYVTSNGDSNNLTSAKNTIIYAIVGLIIVALAQVIVQFVVSKVSDKNKKSSYVQVLTQYKATASTLYSLKSL